MTGRTTAPQPPTLIRQRDIEYVIAARAAVERAMKRHHEDNPAKYHDDRPSLVKCPYKADCPFMGVAHP